MHLPPDVVGHALRKLGQVLLVLEDGRDDLLDPGAEVVERVLSVNHHQFLMQGSPKRFFLGCVNLPLAQWRLHTT